ncbi:hypothetical protein [Haematobacter massiliensis]|uniref:hypothetical protein n=1 Tax=Haematobacter massiliensis TaxID=195105 RepID=UPI00103C5948|nr:hypothetical protein [Haematobacter massiliensis]QBJ25999.1 hypothetical protein HmaOT1_16880 [Haematobacter massiliensis]
MQMIPLAADEGGFIGQHLELGVLYRLGVYRGAVGFAYVRPAPFARTATVRGGGRARPPPRMNEASRQQKGEAAHDQ